MPRLLRLTLGAIAALLCALLLAACTITSQKPLVADTEGIAPLPDSFTFFPYEAANEGYVRSSDAPATFERDGNHYLASNIPDVKGVLDVRFLSIGEATYLLAIRDGDTPGMIYAFARYADGVLSVSLAPDDSTRTAIEAEHKSAMPKARHALAGLTESGETDAITLRSRAALDHLAAMYAAGRLPMAQPAIAYISENPDATPPSRLVPAGPHWIKTP